MKGPFLLATALALLAGCGGSGNGTVAHVGDDAIAQKQLDAVVAHDTVVTQLRYEAVFARVTKGVTGSTEAQRSARRNRRMAEFVARFERETKVRYEPGYAPGS